MKKEEEIFELLKTNRKLGIEELYKNYSKPVIEGKDLAVFNVNEEVDLLQGITATDYEDGNLTSKINVKTDYEKGI